MTGAEVVLFGYGPQGTATIDALHRAGANVAALVVPSNRSGPDVERALARARDLGLTSLRQPPRRKLEPFSTELKRLEPDLIVVSSYSMILPREVIEIARLGCVNVHGGLLPEYRGGHVLQWAIVRGEKETGVTLHWIDEGVDTGPLIAQARFAIEADDDAASLRDKLALAGGALLEEWWPAIAEGRAPRIPQDETRARYWPLRSIEDGRIDWSASSGTVHNLVRALVAPWPGAFTYWEGHRWRVCRTRTASPPVVSVRPFPGEITAVTDEGLEVAAGEGRLWISRIEIDGRSLAGSEIGRLGIGVGARLGGGPGGSGQNGQ